MDSVCSIPNGQGSPAWSTQIIVEVAEPDLIEFGVEDEEDLPEVTIMKEVAATQTNDGFSLSKEKLRRAEKAQKREEKKKEEVVNNKKAEDEATDTRALCRNHAKGNCRHGIAGKSIYNRQKCRFRHPKHCTKWINHGYNKPNGCQEGRKCNLFHHNICKDSLLSRSCPNIKDKAKCQSGYHLLNTKLRVVPARPIPSLFPPQQHLRVDQPWPQLSTPYVQPQAPVGPSGPWGGGEGPLPYHQPFFLNHNIWWSVNHNHRWITTFLWFSSQLSKPIHHLALLILFTCEP